MTKTELKKLVKECLTEILSEDFIKRTINESIADKIKIDVQIPGMRSSNTTVSEKQSAAVAPTQKKQQISEDMRERMRKLVRGDDDVPLVTGAANLKIVDAVNKIQDPIFKEMAKDTLNRETTKIEQQMSFSDVEKNFVDFSKISAISEALEK